MNTNTWITLVNIIIPSIAALLGSYWQIRAMRAMANPAQNPPKPTRNVIGKVTYFIKRYKAELVGTVFPAIGLVFGLTLPLPFEFRLSIIAINSVFFTLNATVYLARSYVNSLMDQRMQAVHDLVDAMIKSQRSINKSMKNADGIRKGYSVLHDLQEKNVAMLERRIEELHKLAERIEHPEE